MMPTLVELKTFQELHYNERLAYEKQTPVHLRTEKQWETISFLRKRVNEFRGIFFNPKSF
jgi:hypothetical protein